MNENMERRTVVAQMPIDWIAMTTNTHFTTKVAGRAASKAKTATPEYVDIGPFTGKRPTVEFRPGSSRCQCGRCGLAFTSPSGFDKHQRLTKEGDIICLNPQTVGLVERDGWWSFPPDPRFAKTEDACTQ